MPGEVELERMIIRLIGEDSSFQKMMESAHEAGQKFERTAQQTSKAEDQLNEAMRQGAAVTRAAETATEKYNRTLQDMSNLYNTVDKATGKKAISQETFNRVMKESEKLLPEFAQAAEDQARRVQKSAELQIKAERDKAQAIRDAQQVSRMVRSPEQDFKATQGRLRGLVSEGGLSMEDYNKAVDAARQQLPEEQKKQQTKMKIESITETTMTAQERYNKRIEELNGLLKDGLPMETYQRAVKQTASILIGAGNETTQAMQSIGMGLTAAGTAIAGVGYLITGSLMSWGHQAIESAKSFEQTTVSFEAYLGSASKAQNLLQEMTVLSAKTPFEMPTLLSASKMMLQFGVSTERVLPLLKAIGDVTGGSDPHKVQQMAYALSQMSSAGKLMGQDLMQMVNAGFNPLNEMAKTTGKTLAALREEMSQGKISAEMVMSAFESASGKLNLMEKQSLTLEGRISTLNDNIGLM